MDARRHITHVLVALLSVLIAAVSQAQSGAGAHVHAGDMWYKQMAYAKAIPEYNVAAEMGAVNEHVTKRLADSYMRIGDTENAERWYAQVVKFLNREPRDLYNYAQALKGNGKYAAAEEWMDRYLAAAGSGEQPQRSNIEDFAKKFSMGMDRFTVHSTAINTPYTDMAPAWLGSRNVIFSSSRNRKVGVDRVAAYDGQPFLDLFIADRGPNGELTDPRPLDGTVNSKAHEGPVVCSADQSSMWLTRNNKAKSQNGVSRLSLLRAQRMGDSWGVTEPFVYNNSEVSIGHPALSPDGQRLYFVSDMPGGSGGTDIYVCRMQGGQWSEPENLGTTVNTPWNEMFPFIARDGTLWFSSNGHPGLGGLDVFAAQAGADGKFSTAINAEAPVNSPSDDFALIIDVDGRTGYFTSDRPGGKGGDDIYSFELLKPLEQRYLCTGYVIDDEDGSPLIDVEVRLLDPSGALVASTMTDSKGTYSFSVEKDKEYRVTASLKGRYDGEQHVSTESVDRQQILARDIHLVPEAGIYLRGAARSKDQLGFIPSMNVSVVNLASFFTETKTTGEGGDFNFRLQPNEEYEVLFEKSGFFSMSVPVSTIGMKQGVIDLNEARDLSFDPLVIGRPVPLKYVKWALGSASLDPVAKTELDALAERMQVNPAVRIEVAVHCDARGDATANTALTQKRADAIVEYLRSKGVPKDRMVARGYGASRPLNHCTPGVECTEAEHAVNRRNEYIVTSVAQ